MLYISEFAEVNRSSFTDLPEEEESRNLAVVQNNIMTIYV